MIYNPAQTGAGGSGGFHYTKVRSELANDVYPHFVYQGTDERVIEISGERTLSETDCVDGSVYLLGGTYTQDGSVRDGTPVTEAHLDGSTLVLSGKWVKIFSGVTPVVPPKKD